MISIPRMARRAGLLVCLVYALGILTGCTPAPAAPTASPEPSQIPASQTTVIPSATPVPTFTLMPSSTAIPSPTQTLAPTLAPSPTPTVLPAAAFDQARVTQMRNQVGGVMVTLKVPNLSTVYNVILAGVSYTCSLDEKYPGLLFCWGLSAPPFNKNVNLAFLNPTSGAVVQEVKTYLAEADFAPPGTVTDNSSNCAHKGENQSCEVECRIDQNGNPCIVASCFDACGQTLSIQTCSSNLSDISFCTADQLAAIKKRYNLP